MFPATHELGASARVPLYSRIAARLRAQIMAGEYTPGSRIPSEHELATRFDVGRPTVRQATELLVGEGVLDRRRGSGTYVTRAPREVDLFSAGGTVASFERSGLSVRTRLLGRLASRHVPTDAAGNPFAGRTALFLARLSHLSRTPVLLEEMYFDPAVFPGLEGRRLEGQSLSQLARDNYLLKPETIEQRFCSVRVDRERARRLAIAPHATVLKVDRIIHFYGAPRGFFAQLFCRADRVAFSQTLGPEPRRAQ